MPPKYSYLRLKVPSLSQYNKNNADASEVWCGRTAGSMIHNYYVANRKAGGVAEAWDELITNQWDKAPYDLVFRGGPRANQVAVPGFLLMNPIELVKPTTWETKKLFPIDDAARTAILNGQPLDEDDVIARLDPIIGGLDAFNPVLVWTGLSSSDGTKRRVRHLVCVSGYRVDADGSFWLHIDDPSSTAYEAGKLRPLGLEGVIEATKPMGIPDAICQVHPDTQADERPGRRYWLRAAVLFLPNLHSVNSNTDFWCDHQDTPGFQAAFNHVPESRGSMVEVSGDPRYPVAVPEWEVTALWDAVARSGDPYPLSARRSWHNGIHIPHTDGLTGAGEVFPIAPGRIVIAWFPERKQGEPDRGMVVMRHAIDPKTLCFVDARGTEPPEGATWVHSIYANLAGGTAGADVMLSRIKPKDAKPEPQRFAEVGKGVLWLTQSGTTLTPALHEGLTKKKGEAELFPVDGTDFFGLDAESRLVGVQLDGSPWVLEGDVVKVKEGFTGTAARLFKRTEGSGTGRWFPEKKADLLDITIDASTTLQPVEVFESMGKQRALVELRRVVQGLSDNAPDIAEWERLDALYQDLRGRVCGNAYADLEGVDTTCRDFIDQSIGLMGVQRLEGETEHRGVHVEVFAEVDLTATTNAGGRWTLLEEVPAAGNGTADFFKKQLDALLSATRSRQSTGGAETCDPSLQGPAGDEQPTSLLSLFDDDVPISIGEWVNHCSVPAHARELSQVVAKHGSEWRLDLVADPSNQKALEAYPADLKKALFPAPLGLPGLGADAFYYFHPLRLVEWLRTGIDVALHDLPTDKRDGVSLVLVLGDTELDLVRQGNEDNYRLRLVLGEGADDGEQEDEGSEPQVCEEGEWISRGVLRLGGIDTMHPEIEVELMRNEVTALVLTEPGGHAGCLRSIGAGTFGLPFGTSSIMVAEGESHIVHILRDFPGPLDHLACSRATLTLEVRYNVALPDRLSLTLPGDGFLLESVEVTGGVVEEPSGGWGSSSCFEVAIAKEPDDDDDDDADEIVTGSSMLLVKAIVVPLGSAGSSGSVQMEIAGGDLVEPVKGEWEVRQRDIPIGARGQDVAKLQLYLSQILCGSSGCLRSKTGSIGTVDGDYGEGTSLAIWRFLLHWRAWSGPEHPVKAAKGDVVLDGVARTQEELEAEAARLHAESGGPTVTQELLDLIVSYYELPYIGVACSIEVDAPALTEPLPEIEKHWAEWNDAQRTRVVPLDGVVQLHMTVKCEAIVPGDLGSVSVRVELQQADAYRLVGPATMSLADLVDVGVMLVPSGNLNLPKTKPRLVVWAESGAEVVAMDLGGSTDVRADGMEIGLDAAMIQKWLTQLRNKKGQPYLTAVDGEFGSGSKKGFDAFFADNYKKNEKPPYAEILELMARDECQEAAQ